MSVDVNDVMCDDNEECRYPFDSSFDEVNMHGWIENIKNQCNLKINALNELMNKMAGA